MTLILNEIHLIDGFNETMIVAAADRRLSINGRYADTRQKLFEIPYLRGTVSYFGLAEVFPNGKNQLLSDWLPSFIRSQNHVKTLEEFSGNLREELHNVIPQETLSRYASGFHICGYNNQNIPEFWYLSNIGGLDGFNYVETKPRYAEPSSDWLGRDAKNFGWDGKDLSSVTEKVIWVYRNGDFRGHAVASEPLDRVFNTLFQFKDFKKPKTKDEYKEYVKTKFEIITYIYKKLNNTQIIGTPIDVVVLSSKDKK